MDVVFPLLQGQSTDALVGCVVDGFGISADYYLSEGDLIGSRANQMMTIDVQGQAIPTGTLFREGRQLQYLGLESLYYDNGNHEVVPHFLLLEEGDYKHER